MEGMDHYIFDWGGAWAIFFCRNIFSSLITIGDLRLNFISLACNIFICVVLSAMHDIYFFYKSCCAGYFFALAQPPLKNKMIRP